MLIKSRKGWEIAERDATPEAVFFARRRLLGQIGLGGALLAAGLLGACDGKAEKEAAAVLPDPSLPRYPAVRNARYLLDRPLTDPEEALTYNNFYEFGSYKQISAAAQKLTIRPWEIQFDGLVKKPKTISADELITAMPLEERLYRHRCVEAWSMAVPWTGFPLAKLIEWAEPQGAANYLRMETFQRPEEARGQRQEWYPWPYVEGLTMAEATNELAFIATGVYGKPMPKQMGAPLRLATPWKYGFKSIKSIVRFSFTAERPATFWERIGPKEYGFWANVNPEVAHPRWSQAREEVLGTGEKVPTLLFNGYGEFVAQLYKDMKDVTLFR